VYEKCPINTGHFFISDTAPGLQIKKSYQNLATQSIFSIEAAITVSVSYYDRKAEPLTYPFVQKTFHTVRKRTFPIFNQREAYRY